MLGFNELAENLVTDEQAQLKNYLEQSRTAIFRARDLVRQLLIYSRGEATDDSPHLVLNQAVRHATKLLISMLPKTIVFSVEIPDELIEVRMNELHLQQILINLCLNARDAMPDGGQLTVGISRQHLDEEMCLISNQPVSGDFAELRVEDNGTGIKAADIDYIFQPFYSTKSVGEGSGMGLSVVAGLLRSYQGHVMIDTQTGIGTRFRLYFPL